MRGVLRSTFIIIPHYFIVCFSSSSSSSSSWSSIRTCRYVYIYIIRAEQTSRSQNSFSTARGILFGTDDGIREGVGFVQPADRLSSIVRCKYGIVPESPANARKISFSSSRCVLLLAISFRIAIEESSNAVFLSNTREQIKSSRLIVRYSRYLLARNR